MFNSQNRDHTLDDLVEIWKQSTFTKRRNVSLSVRRGPWLFRSWASGLGSAKLVSSCLRSLKELRAATTKPGIVKLLVCCEEILKKKEKSLSSQMSVLDFTKSNAGSAVGHWLLLYIIPSYNLRTVSLFKFSSCYSFYAKLSGIFRAKISSNPPTK